MAEALAVAEDAQETEPALAFTADGKHQRVDMLLFQHPPGERRTVGYHAVVAVLAQLGDQTLRAVFPTLEHQHPGVRAGFGRRVDVTGRIIVLAIRSDDREPDVEPGARAVGGDEADLAAEPLDKRAGDRQPESGATPAAGVGRIGLGEPLEHALAE